MPGIKTYKLEDNFKKLKNAIQEYKLEVTAQRINQEKKLPIDFTKLLYWRNSIDFYMFLVEKSLQ